MTRARMGGLAAMLLPLAFVLASRIVGLGRELIISAGFGLSAATDAFYQLSAIPTYLITYVTGPFATAYIVWATGARALPETRQLPIMRRWTAVASVLVASVFLVGVAVITGVHGHARDMIAAAMMAIACVMLGRVGLGTAVSNARGRFGRAQGLLFANNLTFVLLLGLGALLGPGGDVLLVLCGAFCVASLVAAGFAQRALLPQEAAEPADPSANAEATRRSIRRDLLPNLLYASVETGAFLLTQSVVLVLASSSGVGTTSAASLAQRLCLTANGLFVNPLSNMAMVHTSRRKGTDQRGYATRIVLTTLAALAAVAILLVVARRWLPELAEHGGRFSRSNAELLAALIPAYALWLVAQGTSLMLSRLSFTLGHARLYTVLTTAGYLVANLARVLSWWKLGFVAAVAAGAAIELAVALAVLALVARHPRRQASMPTELQGAQA
ncbi:hypothetical protein K7957_07735 [Sphingomonas yunnanensis]|uniref:lipid II flippase MurJ n=1 Tax=Sphingomonas yunnanensis TaxID=310400 RepID=UPI001CA65C32|nr:lipid II flippase MurJ [Sphingomonas yunnanensis]MBY9062819.1 hypothetical protein [Sphingomonas yunnanensis]